MKDLKLRHLKELVAAIKTENTRQLKKWGIQDRSPFEWMTYLTEEIGELAEAISEDWYRAGNAQAVYKEAIEAATLALKIAEMYRHGSRFR